MELLRACLPSKPSKSTCILSVERIPDGQVLHLCLLSFKLYVCCSVCLGTATLPFSFPLVAAPLHSQCPRQCLIHLYWNTRKNVQIVGSGDMRVSSSVFLAVAPYSCKSVSLLTGLSGGGLQLEQLQDSISHLRSEWQTLPQISLKLLISQR